MRLRPSLYAPYMAIFVVGGTAACAPHHILYASLEPAWLCAFLIVLSGAYAAARLPSITARLSVVTLAGTIAWILGALWPFGGAPANAGEFLGEVADWWSFFLFTGACVLILAFAAELTLRFAMRLVDGQIPSPAKREREGPAA
jgi:hypothetical protein